MAVPRQINAEIAAPCGDAPLNRPELRLNRFKIWVWDL
ncbi:hypothetical protein A4U88_4737 [Serratia marcescens]|nr:hypothetical protein A4U88_4737 [Serratia marcescens]